MRAIWIPFTNGTAATFWQERNCYVCRNASHCSAALALRRCGYFTDRNVDICGGNRSEQATGKFTHLPERCASFNKRLERFFTPVEKMKNGLFGARPVEIICDESRGFPGDKAGPTRK